MMFELWTNISAKLPSIPKRATWQTNDLVTYISLCMGSSSGDVEFTSRAYAAMLWIWFNPERKQRAQMNYNSLVAPLGVGFWVIPVHTSLVFVEGLSIRIRCTMLNLNKVFSKQS